MRLPARQHDNPSTWTRTTRPVRLAWVSNAGCRRKRRMNSAALASSHIQPNQQAGCGEHRGSGAAHPKPIVWRGNVQRKGQRWGSAATTFIRLERIGWLPSAAPSRWARICFCQSASISAMLPWKGTAGIVSNGIDDVLPTLSAAEFLTPGRNEAMLGDCDSGAIRQAAPLNKLLLRGLNLPQIVVTPRLRIRAGVNTSDHQERAQADQPAAQTGAIPCAPPFRRGGSTARVQPRLR